MNLLTKPLNDDSKQQLQETDNINNIAISNGYVMLNNNDQDQDQNQNQDASGTPPPPLPPSEEEEKKAFEEYKQHQYRSLVPDRPTPGGPGGMYAYITPQRPRTPTPPPPPPPG